MLNRKAIYVNRAGVSLRVNEEKCYDDQIIWMRDDNGLDYCRESESFSLNALRIGDIRLAVEDPERTSADVLTDAAHERTLAGLERGEDGL